MNSINPIAFIRLPAITKMTSLSRSSIYRLINTGDFPRQVQLSTRTVAWRLTDVEHWISQKINQQH